MTAANRSHPGADGQRPTSNGRHADDSLTSNGSERAAADTPSFLGDTPSEVAESSLEPLALAFDKSLAAGAGQPALDEAALSGTERTRLRTLRSVMHSLQLLRDVPPESESEPSGESSINRFMVATAVKGHFGRFHVERLLGHGGHGVVYLAFDPVLRRRVALKIPQPEVLLDPEMRERFLREARSAAMLDHPNIVAVYEAGTTGGVCFIAMEYCSGRTLADFLGDDRGSSLSPRAWAKLFRALADALDYTHSCGVLHRDLKPGNILLFPGTKTGGAAALVDELPFVPKLTDFGLAKVLEDSAARTRTYVAAGTPLYMSPEQAARRRDEVDARADVHGLGVIMYEALTGKTPFDAESLLGVLEAVRHRQPVPPHRLNKSVPRDLSTICLKCLEKPPAGRYQTAAELAEDLERFLERRPIKAKPMGRAERGILWCRRRPAAAGLMVVSFVACLAALVGTFWHRQQVAHLDALNRNSEYGRLVDETEGIIGRPRIGWTVDGLQKLRAASECDVPIRDVVKLRSMAAALLCGHDLHTTATISTDIRSACLAFTANHQLLAIGDNQDEDGVVKVDVWNLATRMPIWHLTFPLGTPQRSHPDGVRSLLFTSDGRYLLAGTRYGAVHAWNLSEMPPARRGWQVHSDRVTALVEVGPGRILSASADGWMALSRVWTGEQIGRRFYHRVVSSIELSEFRAADMPVQGMALASIDGHLRMALWPNSNRGKSEAVCPTATAHEIRAVTVQPDGKIVATGVARANGHSQVALVRFDGGGYLDAAFRPAAFRTDYDSTDGAADAIAVDSQGRIIVGGTLTETGGRTSPLVARFTPRGALDRTFGDGGVLVIKGVEGRGRAIAIERSGAVIVAGETSGQGLSEMLAVRVNAEGKLASGFGERGIVRLHVSGAETDDSARAVVTLGDGRLLLVGQSRIDGRERMTAVRLLANGSLDRGFSGTGAVVVDAGPRIASGLLSATVSADGRIVAAGYARHEGEDKCALVHLNSDGQLERAFGGGSGVVLRPFAGPSGHVAGVVMQPDGMIVYGGSAGDPPNSLFTAVRYDAEGTFDQTFGRGGKISTSFAGKNSVATSLALSPTGRIILGGASAPGTAGSSLAVAQFDDDGTLCDSDFPSFGPPIAAAEYLGPIIDKNMMFVTGEGRMSLVDLESQAVLREFAEHESGKAHDADVRTIDVSPDEHFLASGGADGRVKLWDVPSGKLLSNLLIGGADNVAARFDGAGRIIATSDRDIHLIEVNGWQYASVAAMQRSELCDFAISQRQLLTAGGTPLPGHPPKTMGVYTSLTSPQSAEWPATFHHFKWRGLGANTSNEIDLPCGKGERPACLSLHPTRCVAAYVGGDRFVHVAYENAHCQILRDQMKGAAVDPTGKRVWLTYSVTPPETGEAIGAIGACRLDDVSPDGQWLNVESKRQRKSNGLYNLAVGRSWAAAASSDETVKLFPTDVRPLAPRGEVATPNDLGVGLAFSPSDRLLAIGTRKGNLILVDPSSSRKLLETQPNANTVSSVAFSHDGLLLATASFDHRIRLYRVDNQTIEPILDLPEQANRVLKVAFGPNDDILYALVQDEPALRTFRLANLSAELAKLRLDWQR